MAAYDAIVLGLGGMGSAAAYHLARRGAQTLGLEQFGVAHDQGSSHGGTRIIRRAYYEGSDYVPLVLRASVLWRELEHETGATLYRTTGVLHLGSPDAVSVAGAAAVARAHHIPHEMLTAAEIRNRFTVIHPGAGDVGVLEPDGGILSPEQCVAAHIDLAQRHGAALHFGERAGAWSAGPDGITVRTARGTYQAGRLVITAGPWAAQLLESLHLPLDVRRVVNYWFEPRDQAEEFRRMPAVLWEERGVNAFATPYLAGDGLKCGFHHDFTEPTTPQTIRREVGADEIARIRERITALMPEATGMLRATMTCMYTVTPDRHFIIDRHPGHENVLLACGFSGHGFKFCSVVGEALADLALTGATAQPIGLFTLRRFGSPVL
jgi:sarcosine oxidase